jgi:uncharacterized OsmC-like protein
MEIARFRETQDSIRQTYRRNPKAALLTLKANGSANDPAVACKVETGRGTVLAGIHSKAGGSGLDLCSGDLLLEALVACAGVSLRAAAAVLDIPLRSAVVSVEGDVDLRGTLGVATDVPVGFRTIRLRLDLDTDATQHQLDQLLALTGRYCIVFQTIQNSPATSIRLNRIRH